LSAENIAGLGIDIVLVNVFKKHLLMTGIVQQNEHIIQFLRFNSGFFK